MSPESSRSAPASSRAGRRWRSPTRHDGVVRRPRHRPAPGCAAGGRSPRRAPRAARHIRRPSRSARPASTLCVATPPPERAAPPLRRTARARRRARPPRGRPQPRGGRRDGRALVHRSRHGRPPLLLVAAASSSTGSRAWLLRLVRRQRDVSERGTPFARLPAPFRRTDPRRDRQPVPRAAADARHAERARQRGPHGACSRRSARRGNRDASPPRHTPMRPQHSGWRDRRARRRRSASTSSSTRTSSV